MNKRTLSLLLSLTLLTGAVRPAPSQDRALNGNPNLPRAGRPAPAPNALDAAGPNRPSPVSVTLVKDINTTTSLSSEPGSGIAVNGVLFYTCDDGIHGRELWKSDGTAAGTVLVKDIRPGVASALRHWDDGELTAVGDTLFFTADDGTSGRELWKSDGTATGTVLVKDIRPGPDTPSPHSLNAVGHTLYFFADDGMAGYALWRSDGTEAGTIPIKEHISGGGISQAVVAGSTLFFLADFFGETGYGYRLWKSDGTAAGTVIVMAEDSLSYDPLHYLTALGNVLFFERYEQLWKCDGTAAGTVPVLERVIAPLHLTAAGSTLFFAANDGTNGFELWKSDGTEAGTVRVRDINPGFGSSYLERFAVVGRTIFFTAFEETSGMELWKTDGTEAGTVRVKDLLPGPEDYYLSSLHIAVGDTLFFTAYDRGTAKYSLWKTDGTEAGTIRVRDLPGSGSDTSYPYSLTAVGRMLFFGARSDDFGGWELWMSDGTEAGTVLAADIYPGSDGSNPDWLVAMGDRLYFSATDPVRGRELWMALVPQLHIAPTNGAVRVSWDKLATGFVLDETPALAPAPAAWTPVPLPRQTNGTHISITAPTASGNKFYRLRQP